MLSYKEWYLLSDLRRSVLGPDARGDIRVHASIADQLSIDTDHGRPLVSKITTLPFLWVVRLIILWTVSPSGKDSWQWRPEPLSYLRRHQIDEVLLADRLVRS